MSKLQIATRLLIRHDVTIDYLGVGGDPVGRFTVVITFLSPLPQPTAFDRVMPVLSA